MIINNYAVYKLDAGSNTVSNISQEVAGDDFDQYLNDLINYHDLPSPNFTFQRSTTEVNSIIRGIFSGDNFYNGSKTIAERLLYHEIEAQQKIAHLNKSIQQGVLIQVYLTESETNKFFICKADDLEFLNEANFRRTKGLPIKKKIFKSFIGESNNDEVIAKVFDTNPTMTAYWWQNFLELEKIYDDAHNTSKALQSLDMKILNPIKKISPADFTILRNSTIRYFRANEEFNLEDYISEIIDGYEPEKNDSVDIEKIKEKIRKLPEKSKFDARFSIDRNSIKKRIPTKYNLSSSIELIVKQEVEIGTTIKAVQDQDGQKYVKIRSDEGYRHFKKKNSND